MYIPVVSDEEPDLGSAFSRAVLVDTTDGISTMVAALQGLPTTPPSLYVDLEGIDLCRHGSISILQIYVLPVKKTYLVDVHLLRGAAFSTPSSNGQTLRGILESTTTPKVFFDVRNDSDALYSHYQVSLGGIQDLQLMEFATRSSNGRFLSGLAKCIEVDARLPYSEQTALEAIKSKGQSLFLPRLGGSYKVFNERPLSPDIMAYCIADVEILPWLWAFYKSKFKPRDEQKVLRGSIDRVELSQRSDYDGKGRHMAIPPPGW